MSEIGNSRQKLQTGVDDARGRFPRTRAFCALLDGIASNELAASNGPPTDPEVTMPARSTFSAVLTTLFLLLAAGCGGSSGAGASSGALLVRSDVLAFVSIDSDLGSGQWQTVNDLSNKFPGRTMALAQIKRALAKQKLDYDRDVKPALGPEVDVAVAGATRNDVKFIVLTKPHDSGKFKDLIKKLNAQDTSGKPAVYKEVHDGWYAVSDSTTSIDNVLNGSGKALAFDLTFDDAMGELPSQALAKAYVNGGQLAKLIHQYNQGRGSGLAGATSGLDKLDFVSASLSAEDDGIRVHGAVQGPGASALAGSGDYRSKLVVDVPADALAFLTFRTGKGLGSALQSMSGSLEYALGISVNELVGLFANESALYVQPGAVIPEVTLLLQPKSTTSALATLDKLARRVARATGATVKGGAEKTIDFGQFAVHYGAKGNKVVITNAATGVAHVGSSGDKLTDSADFKEAKGAAGLPDSNGGFLYLDLKNAIPLIEGFAGLAGQNLPSTVTENLRPLRSFLAWNAGSGNARTFDLFLEIK
jgi:hypothetical protein